MKVDALPALDGVIALFDEAPIVGLAEKHGLEQGAEFVEELVRHPGFAARVQTIAIEFGNALHQDIADAYVAGEDVAPERARRIWLDVVGAGPWGFREPIYPRFFATVREVNRGLSREPRSLLRAKDTWLGGQPAAAVYGAHVTGIDEHGVAYDPALRSTRTLGELCDDYLYLGPSTSLTRSPFDERPIDEADRAELARRMELHPMGPPVPESVGSGPEA